ncbi:MAG: ATP synthase F1 subunit delta [Verrucomicrobiota bacterium]
MRINREARNVAKRLFKQCFIRKNLDENRVQKVVRALIDAKPRNHLAILERFRKLVQIEEAKNRAFVESARPLTSAKSYVQEELNKRFGSKISIKFVVKPELLGGTRIRVGSNVWDGSIKGRLNAISEAI